MTTTQKTEQIVFLLEQCGRVREIMHNLNRTADFQEYNSVLSAQFDAVLSLLDNTSGRFSALIHHLRQLKTKD